jgi:hypothetical protein
MFKWLFTKKKPWKLVKSIALPGVRVSHGKETNGCVYVQCYETAEGDRKFEIDSTFKLANQVELLAYVKSCEEYHNTVVFWMGGRYVVGIPTFTECDSIDISTKLTQ